MVGQAVQVDHFAALNKHGMTIFLNNIMKNKNINTINYYFVAITDNVYKIDKILLDVLDSSCLCNFFGQILLTPDSLNQVGRKHG